jgi:Uma2 family endonuclease
MSTATPLSTHGDASVVLHDVSWDEYCNIVAGRGDRRFHHTYDNGMLEIMSPSRTHEWEKTYLGQAIEKLVDVLEINVVCLGSSTHQREDLLQGLEPDECYYIANEPIVRGRAKEIDLAVDPPPDLAIEIDVASSSIPRLPIYAKLGVPEVWRFDGKRVHVLSLAGEQYLDKPNSIAFPFLTAAKLTELLTEETDEADSERMRRFLAWAREQIS